MSKPEDIPQDAVLVLLRWMDAYTAQSSEPATAAWKDYADVEKLIAKCAARDFIAAIRKATP